MMFETFKIPPRNHGVKKSEIRKRDKKGKLNTDLGKSLHLVEWKSVRNRIEKQKE